MAWPTPWPLPQAATPRWPASRCCGSRRIVGAIVDNIPYTATAIPVVERLIADGLPAAPLWWSLALGACLGGNLTLVGASANIVVANQAARAGHQIGFFEFMRYGAVVTIASLAIATGYVLVFHLA